MERKTDFDAYLMVDWSASSKPAHGADSVWYCLLMWETGSPAVRTLRNPATRHQAVQEIGHLLAEMAAGGLSILVGFDFPYGYPSGFAAALGVGGQPPWRAVWNELAQQIIDRPDNSNNRFEVAAALNRVISGQPYPFWGCPEVRQSPTLSMCKVRAYGPNDLSEYRLTDRQVKGPQPVWKLAGVGSVGSQALLGIPCVAKLRDDPRLAAVSRVWPFETGLTALTPRGQRDWQILHAEIYPSLIQARPGPCEVKDAAQVRDLARYFAEADAQGRLSAWFAGNPSLRARERDCVEREEGRSRRSRRPRPAHARPQGPRRPHCRP